MPFEGVRQQETAKNPEQVLLASGKVERIEKPNPREYSRDGVTFTQLFASLPEEAAELRDFFLHFAEYLELNTIVYREGAFADHDERRLLREQSIAAKRPDVVVFFNRNRLRFNHIMAVLQIVEILDDPEMVARLFPAHTKDLKELPWHEYATRAQELLARCYETDETILEPQENPFDSVPITDKLAIVRDVATLVHEICSRVLAIVAPARAEAA